MANERFTDLPQATPQLTDIICAIQGYMSPTVVGVSVQETLGAILGLVPALNLNFVLISTPTIAMVPNTIYFVDYTSGLCTLTLPVTSVSGQVMYVMGNSAGGWKIAQNADQQLRIGSGLSTAGVDGYLASTNNYNSIALVCTVANTYWTAPTGPQGCITIA